MSRLPTMTGTLRGAAGVTTTRSATGWRKHHTIDRARSMDRYYGHLAAEPVRADRPLAPADAARLYPDAAAYIAGGELDDLRPSAIRRLVEARHARRVEARP